MKSLAEQHVWITGGGTGIGRAIALALAPEVASIVISGRSPDSLAETIQLAAKDAAKDAGEHAGKLRAAPLDVADRPAVMLAEAGMPKVDLLINCAGMNTAKRTIHDIDPADWDRVMTVNATGAFNTIKACLPRMREHGGGLVVNISSVAGKRAVPLGGVAYNASKFAMTALGTSVTLEERQNGIRVTNIYPGEVNTPILDRRPVPVSDEHKARILQPEDVAAAVLMVVRLPLRAHIPELVIKPISQDYA